MKKEKEHTLRLLSQEATQATPPADTPGGRIGNKRLFVGLICGASLLLCLLLLFGWGIPYIGFGNIHPAMPYITGGLAALGVAALMWTAFGLVLQILTGKALPGAGKTRGLAAKLFLPVSEALGRLLGIAPLKVRGSFIQVNNEMVLKQGHKYPPQEILLLLPHCIQKTLCPIRVSADITRCERCGGCDLAGIISLAENYGISVAIATGGTIARRIVVDKRPKMILAVACERDLSSGIQDSYPLPVYGVLNERPHGPCLDTKVPLSLLEDALKHFIRWEKAEGRPYAPAPPNKAASLPRMASRL